MGAINFSLSPDLVQALAETLPLKIFVETGTFQGDTVAGLLTHFDEIHTVELSDHYFERAKARFAGESHVHLARGNSPDYLKQQVGKLSERAVLYFLDAHWCVAATDTAGEQSQCPLLDEIAAIGALGETSVIVIDDARLFLAPPPEPHVLAQWPSFQEIVTALRQLSNVHELMVVNDVIVYYPPAARSSMHSYARREGVDWLQIRQAEQDNERLRASEQEKEAVIQTQNESIMRLHKEQARLGDDLREKEAVIQGQNQSIAQLAKELQDKDAVTRGLLEGMAHAASQQQRLLKAEAAQYAATTLLTPEVHALLVRGLAEKEAVIQEMKKALNAYRSAFALLGFFTRPITRLIPLSAFSGLIPRPRLGTLYHHHPQDVVIPRSYWRAPVLAQTPRISLVTPSFRQALFIDRTIRSVLEQKYPNLEYYVQDGGSEDGTREILERYADRLSGWESRPDEGQSQAINLGFAHTSGEIMAWLNSDDILLPGVLHCVADFFNRHPDVDVIYGHRLLIDENDRLIGRWILPGHDDGVLSWADYIPQETLFWRRTIWEKAGGRIDESFRFAMDWDLLLRFRQAGARFARIPRFMGGFRIHPHQKTSAAIGEIGFKEMDRLRERSLGRVPTHSEVRRALMPYLLRHIACEVGWRIRGKLGGHR